VKTGIFSFVIKGMNYNLKHIQIFKMVIKFQNISVLLYFLSSKCNFREDKNLLHNCAKSDCKLLNDITVALTVSP